MDYLEIRCLISTGIWSCADRPTLHPKRLYGNLNFPGFNHLTKTSRILLRRFAKTSEGAFPGAGRYFVKEEGLQRCSPSDVSKAPLPRPMQTGVISGPRWAITILRFRSFRKMASSSLIEVPYIRYLANSIVQALLRHSE